MPTSRALLASAFLVSAAVVVAAWIATDRASSSDRYQLVNTGSGSTVRLDRITGDLVQCRYSDCAPMIKGGKLISAGDAAATPPPPRGFILEQ
jgi:hypothetical protein